MHKRARLSSRDATHTQVTDLTTLPPFIAKSILLASVSAYQQKKLTINNVRLSEPVQVLTSVSKAWRALALDAASNVALCSLVADFGMATRKDVLELRRQLTLQRAFVLSLDIQGIPQGPLIPTEHWAALLSCVPRLEEVQLDSLVSARNDQLGSIVRAVGQQCKHLQSLFVSAPHRHNHDMLVPAESVRQQLSNPVFYTMEQVYENTNHVGLRRLCVTMRHDLQGLASTRKYLNHVLRYCPNLERFDGYRAAVYGIDTYFCYEQWYMDLDLWYRFCLTLNDLTEFNWVCVPFAIHFFEIFGQHPKRKLKSLRLATPMNWKWERYLREMESSERDLLTETGFSHGQECA